MAPVVTNSRWIQILHGSCSDKLKVNTDLTWLL